MIGVEKNAAGGVGGERGEHQHHQHHHQHDDRDEKQQCLRLEQLLPPPGSSSGSAAGDPEGGAMTAAATTTIAAGDEAGCASAAAAAGGRKPSGAGGYGEEEGSASRHAEQEGGGGGGGGGGGENPSDEEEEEEAQEGAKEGPPACLPPEDHHQQQQQQRQEEDADEEEEIRFTFNAAHAAVAGTPGITHPKKPLLVGLATLKGQGWVADFRREVGCCHLEREGKSLRFVGHRDGGDDEVEGDGSLAAAVYVLSASASAEASPRSRGGEEGGQGEPAAAADSSSSSSPAEPETSHSAAAPVANEGEEEPEGCKGGGDEEEGGGGEGDREHEDEQHRELHPEAQGGAAGEQEEPEPGGLLLGAGEGDAGGLLLRRERSEGAGVEGDDDEEEEEEEEDGKDKDKQQQLLQHHSPEGDGDCTAAAAAASASALAPAPSDDEKDGCGEGEGEEHHESEGSAALSPEAEAEGCEGEQSEKPEEEPAGAEAGADADADADNEHLDEDIVPAPPPDVEGKGDEDGQHEQAEGEEEDRHHHDGGPVAEEGDEDQQSQQSGGGSGGTGGSSDDREHPGDPVEEQADEDEQHEQSEGGSGAGAGDDEEDDQKHPGGPVEEEGDEEEQQEQSEAGGDGEDQDRQHPGDPVQADGDEEEQQDRPEEKEKTDDAEEGDRQHPVGSSEEEGDEEEVDEEKEEDWQHAGEPVEDQGNRVQQEANQINVEKEADRQIPGDPVQEKGDDDGQEDRSEEEELVVEAEKVEEQEDAQQQQQADEVVVVDADTDTAEKDTGEGEVQQQEEEGSEGPPPADQEVDRDDAELADADAKEGSDVGLARQKSEDAEDSEYVDASDGEHLPSSGNGDADVPQAPLSPASAPEYVDADDGQHPPPPPVSSGAEEAVEPSSTSAPMAEEEQGKEEEEEDAEAVAGEIEPSGTFVSAQKDIGADSEAEYEVDRDAKCEPEALEVIDVQEQPRDIAPAEADEKVVAEGENAEAEDADAHAAAERDVDSDAKYLRQPGVQAEEEVVVVAAAAAAEEEKTVDAPVGDRDQEASYNSLSGSTVEEKADADAEGQANSEADVASSDKDDTEQSPGGRASPSPTEEDVQDDSKHEDEDHRSPPPPVQDSAEVEAEEDLTKEDVRDENDKDRRPLPQDPSLPTPVHDSVDLESEEGPTKEDVQDENEEDQRPPPPEAAVPTPVEDSVVLDAEEGPAEDDVQDEPKRQGEGQQRHLECSVTPTPAAEKAEKAEKEEVPRKVEPEGEEVPATTKGSIQADPEHEGDEEVPLTLVEGKSEAEQEDAPHTTRDNVQADLEQRSEDQPQHSEDSAPPTLVEEKVEVGQEEAPRPTKVDAQEHPVDDQPQNPEGSTRPTPIEVEAEAAQLLQQDQEKQLVEEDAKASDLLEQQEAEEVAAREVGDGHHSSDSTGSPSEKQAGKGGSELVGVGNDDSRHLENDDEAKAAALCEEEQNQQEQESDRSNEDEESDHSIEDKEVNNRAPLPPAGGEQQKEKPHPPIEDQSKPPEPDVVQEQQVSISDGEREVEVGDRKKRLPKSVAVEAVTDIPQQEPQQEGIDNAVVASARSPLSPTEDRKSKSPPPAVDEEEGVVDEGDTEDETRNESCQQVGNEELQPEPAASPGKVEAHDKKDSPPVSAAVGEDPQVTEDVKNSTSTSAIVSMIIRCAMASAAGVSSAVAWVLKELLERMSDYVTVIPQRPRLDDATSITASILNHRITSSVDSARVALLQVLLRLAKDKKKKEVAAWIASAFFSSYCIARRRAYNIRRRMEQEKPRMFLGVDESLLFESPVSHAIPRNRTSVKMIYFTTMLGLIAGGQVLIESFLKKYRLLSSTATHDRYVEATRLLQRIQNYVQSFPRDDENQHEDKEEEGYSKPEGQPCPSRSSSCEKCVPVTHLIPPPPPQEQRRYVELLVHNVSHTDLVFGLDDPSFSSRDSADDDPYYLCRPRFSCFAKYSKMVLESLQDSSGKGREIGDFSHLINFPRYRREAQSPRKIDYATKLPGVDTPAGIRLDEAAPGVEWHEVRLRGKDQARLHLPSTLGDGHAASSSTVAASVSNSVDFSAASKSSHPTASLRHVFFPLLATLLPKWREQIEEKEYDTSASTIKRVLILVSGVGTPRNWTHDARGNSTEYCALLMKEFLRRVDPSLTVVCIHSETNVFRYDENLVFVERELMPTIHAYRDAHARGLPYPDVTRSLTDGDQEDQHSLRTHPFSVDWRSSFYTTLSFADGSPARTFSIQQALRPYKPAYFHLWQLKTFWHEQKLVLDDIEVHDFSAMETIPAVDTASCTNEDIRMVVDDIKTFRSEMRQALLSDSDIRSFWLRKTHKPVIAVLLVRSAETGGQAVLYRGTNMEVSMPTGSLCAERNVIGTALADRPGLKREDLKLIAVLAVPNAEPETIHRVPSSASMSVGTSSRKPSVESEAAAYSSGGVATATNDSAWIASISPSTSSHRLSSEDEAPSAPPNAPLRRIALLSKGAPSTHKSNNSKRTVVLHSTGKDLNPLQPCGACNEWLKKIAESNPYFRVLTFTDADCNGVYVTPCQE